MSDPTESIRRQQLADRAERGQAGRRHRARVRNPDQFERDVGGHGRQGNDHRRGDGRQEQHQQYGTAGSQPSEKGGS